MTASSTDLGPPVLAQGVEGGPDGAPGEQHVVDQHHGGPGQVEADVGGRLGQDGPQADVVAVEGHVQGARPGRSPPRPRPGCRPAARRWPRRRSAGRSGPRASRPRLRSAISWAMRVMARVHVGGRHDLGTGNEDSTPRAGMTALAFGHLNPPVRTGLTGPASRSGTDYTASPLERVRARGCQSAWAGAGHPGPRGHRGEHAVHEATRSRPSNNAPRRGRRPR